MVRSVLCHRRRGRCLGLGRGIRFGWSFLAHWPFPSTTLTAVQKRRHDDVIVTTMFPIVGRIEGQALKVDSRIFGKVLLPLAHTLQVRSLTAEPEAAEEAKSDLCNW